MWELQNTDKIPREFEVKQTIDIRNTRCAICGEYFNADDKYHIIVCNAIPEARKAGLTNKIVHTGCWSEFSSGITDNEALALKLKKHRRKTPQLSENQMQYLIAFKEAAYKYGFSNIKNTKNKFCIAHMPKTLMKLVYNPFSDVLTLDCSYKHQGLFDVFYRKEILVKVRNAMNESLGIEKKELYSASAEIQKIINETTQMLTEIL